MGITRSQLLDSLNLLAAVSLRKIEVNDLMLSIYLDDLMTVAKDDFDSAIKHFYNCRIFPTSSELLEFISGNNFNEDWCKIVAVVRETSKSETISGVSSTALIKITSSTGIRSALLTIAKADDYQLNRYRDDWLKQVKRVDLAGLPPTNCNITLATPAAKRDMDYPPDDDFSVRTASLIRLLRAKEIKPSTVQMCSANFPTIRRAEIATVFEELGLDYSKTESTRKSSQLIVPEDFAA